MALRLTVFSVGGGGLTEALPDRVRVAGMPEGGIGGAGGGPRVTAADDVIWFRALVPSSLSDVTIPTIPASRDIT